MTPATRAEFAPDLLGLLAAAGPAVGLDDCLSRLATWWQRALAAAEVLVVANGTTGRVASWERSHSGPSAQSSAHVSCTSSDVSALTAAPPSSGRETSAERIVQLTEGGHTLGCIKIVGAQQSEIPDDWLAATALLLAQARERELRLRDAKLSALAEFAAGAGHEINNPLATILICSQRLQQKTVDPEQRRLLATIGGQALRVRDMIGDVMLFARPPEPRTESIDLGPAVADVLARFHEQIAVAAIAVTFQPGQDLCVRADPTQLRIVISELLRNAIDAQPEGGRITIVCESGTDDSAEFAVLSIADAGGGLDDTSRRHLFDPFFSGRPAGRGLGFGLSKVWRITDQHSGRIEVAEPPEGGLVLSVYWPIAEGSS